MEISFPIVWIHGELSDEPWRKLFVKARAGTTWFPCFSKTPVLIPFYGVPCSLMFFLPNRHWRRERDVVAESKQFTNDSQPCIAI